MGGDLAKLSHEFFLVSFLRTQCSHDMIDIHVSLLTSDDILKFGILTFI